MANGALVRWMSADPCHCRTNANGESGSGSLPKPYLGGRTVNPKQSWLQRRESKAQWKAEGEAITAALNSSSNSAALRRTVAYVALYRELTNTQFTAAHGKDPLLAGAAPAQDLLDEAVEARLLVRGEAGTDGKCAYGLSVRSATHIGWFLAGGRRIFTEQEVAAGYLNRSPGRLVTPPPNAERDFGH